MTSFKEEKLDHTDYYAHVIVRIMEAEVIKAPNPSSVISLRRSDKRQLIWLSQSFIKKMKAIKSLWRTEDICTLDLIPVWKDFYICYNTVQLTR